MKKIIIFICLVSLFTSCREEEYSVNVTRILRNATDYEIKVLLYDEEFLVEEFSIPKQSSDTLNSKCTYVRGRLQNCPPVWSMENDSVKLIFSQERELLYCLSNPDCNIINDKNIMEVSLIQNSEQSNSGYQEVEDNVFVFTIEESDYELATPINK